METQTIDRNSTKREMLFFLTGVSKNHIVAICMHANRCGDYDLNLYGRKSDLISALVDVEREDLWAAIDAIVEDDDVEELPESASDPSAGEDEEDSQEACESCSEGGDEEDEDIDDEDE